MVRCVYTTLSLTDLCSPVLPSYPPPVDAGGAEGVCLVADVCLIADTAPSAPACEGGVLATFCGAAPPASDALVDAA
jgi:hypothetical protein